MSEKKNRKFVWGKRIIITILSILILCMLIILFIRSQWGQEIIVNKAVDYVSEKTDTTIDIDKLYLTFSGNVLLEGLYVEDQKNDTLVYSDYLEASIALLPLLQGNKLHIKSVDWKGLVAKIKKKENQNFNYQFLIDSLSSSTDTTTIQTSDPFEIIIEDINLEDITLDYKNETQGNTLWAKLGTLKTAIQKFDLTNMTFEVNTFDLDNTIIVFDQYKDIISEESSEAMVLPNFALDKLNLNMITFTYQSEPDQLFIESAITDGALKSVNVDLPKQTIDLELFEVNNSAFALKDLSNTDKKQPLRQNNNDTFIWPNWRINADQVSISNQQFSYLTKNQISQNGVFDPENFNITQLKANLSDFTYRPKNTEVRINHISFAERSGFSVKNFSSFAALSDTTSKISNLALQTNHNYVQGSVVLNYDSVQNLIHSPGASDLNLDLSKINSSLSDIAYFQPSLMDNEYIQKLSTKNIHGFITANGNLDNVQLQELFLQWGDSTKITLNGGIKNLSTPDSLYFNNISTKIKVYRSDVSAFMNPDTLGITIPDSISVNGWLQGSLSKFTTDATINSTLGDVIIEGKLDINDFPGFTGNISANQLHLNKIVKNPQLGTLSFSSDIDVRGNSLSTLDATVQTSFDDLTYKSYDFSALQLNAEINNGKGRLSSRFKDENLNMHLTANVDLDSVSSVVTIDTKVIGADLHALGITKKVIKTQFDLNATFKGNLDDFNINAKTSGATVVYQNEPYNVENIQVSAKNTSQRTAFSIRSGFLNGKLSSNSTVQNTFEAIQRQLLEYINPKEKNNENQTPVNTKIKISFKETPIINEVFIPGLRTSDTIRIKASFSEGTNELTAKIKTERINFGESTLNRLDISANGTQNQMKFKVAWDSIVSNPLRINATEISGQLAQQKLKLNFDAFDFEKKSTAHLVAEAEFKKDTLHFHIDPSSLILDKTPWKIDAQNSVVVSDDYISVDNFVISNGNQSLAITTNRIDINKKHINFDFNNFQLSNITRVLNENQLIASGQVNGEICIEEPLGKTGMISDVSINELSIIEIPLGKLHLDAESERFSSYTLDMSLKGPKVDLGFSGDFIAKEKKPNVNLTLDLKKLEINIIERFFESYISNATGSLAGTAKIKGNLDSPLYSGDFHFDNAGLEVNTLNTRFILPEENMKITNDQVTLNTFTIKDANGDSFTLDGTIKTKSITNPSFDLSLTANDFTVLNSTKEDSDIFYGKVNINSDLQIRGDLEVPVIRGTLSLDENSDFTLVVPESELEIKEREGVVIFVNRENPDAILTRVDEKKSEITFLQGFDIQTRLRIGKQSTFQIIIDETTNDFIQVHGKGDFVFGMEPNGRTTLTGRYDISDGLYRVSLYDLVAREFEIKPGGTIIWKGDPLEADLDVTAVYRVETSPLPLVNSRTNLQARDVDFLVYLNVDEELLTPEISFELDMPEEDRGVLGGAIYGQVQQLNNQEAELNKQVFSLLVLNRFFPESGSDGSSGGVAKLARDNVNSVLAGQLNSISKKIIGASDFDLNFDLNSYGTYQGNTTNNATDLEINAQKSFLDDRLIVQVGSAVNVEGNSQATEESSPIIGNVSLEYLLTQNGRFRLKGFRKNQFESVIDGQLIVTGIAFIFNREFNKFKDLWRSSVQKELKKREEQQKNEE